MKNKNITVFASDLNSYTGEGTLGRIFLNKILHNNKNLKIKIITPNQNILFKGNFNKVNNYYQNSIIHKYLSPIIGALKLRFTSRDVKIIYVNYLPLWNFILFLILPKRTILGPITGSNEKIKIENLNFFIRKVFFPLFYKLSLMIIKKKFKTVVFSTDLLKNFVKNNTNSKLSKNYLFDFIYCGFNQNFAYQFKLRKKRNLILFYNKKHITKTNYKLISFIFKISKQYQVTIIGDKLKYKNLKNLGYLSKKKLQLILKKANFVISSNENLMSLFNLDAINNGAFVIYDKDLFKRKIKNNSPYIGINFNNFPKSLIKNLKQNHNKYKINKYFSKTIEIKQHKISKFLQEY